MVGSSSNLVIAGVVQLQTKGRGGDGGDDAMV